MRIPRWNQRLVHQLAELDVGGGLHHEDGEQLVLAVDPELGAVGPAPGVAALPSTGPAQPVLLAAPFQVILEHQIQGLGLEDPRAIEFAAVEEHPAETFVVDRRRAKPLAAEADYARIG
jgi:hypothetical protein